MRPASGYVGEEKVRFFYYNENNEIIYYQLDYSKMFIGPDIYYEHKGDARQFFIKNGIFGIINEPINPVPTIIIYSVAINQNGNYFDVNYGEEIEPVQNILIPNTNSIYLKLFDLTNIKSEALCIHLSPKNPPPS